eukprot:1833903-Amphidinium_carterae.1
MPILSQHFNLGELIRCLPRQDTLRASAACCVREVVALQAGLQKTTLPLCAHETAAKLTLCFIQVSKTLHRRTLRKRHGKALIVASKYHPAQWHLKHSMACTPAAPSKKQ